MTTGLVATCWTSAGSANPWKTDDSSPEAIADRLEAIHDAGFVGLGLRHGDLARIERTLGWPRLRQLLDRYAFSTFEVEFLEDWFEKGEARERSDVVRWDLIRAAEALGADHLKVGPRMSGGALDADQMAEELYELCVQAADVGARVGLEPMPFSNVPSPSVGLDIVRRAGHPAAGIFLDAWHVFRGDIPLESIRMLPLEYIVGVELADAHAAVVGTMLEDTLNNRLLPGEGSFDLPSFVLAVRETGFVGPWGVEIISETFRAMPMNEGVHKAHAASAPLVVERLPGETSGED